MGEWGYSNMKLVYICRTLFKNGGGGAEEAAPH